MWKKLSILAVALSLVAPPIAFADNKPGKPAKPQPTITKVQKKPQKPNSQGTVTGKVSPGFDMPTNSAPPR